MLDISGHIVLAVRTQARLSAREQHGARQSRGEQDGSHFVPNRCWVQLGAAESSST
jgi:hypothetical protein